MPYILQGQKCGTVRVDDHGTVMDEGKKHSGKLTSYPIENGADINDHFEREPTTGTLKGVLVDGGSAVATLEAMHEKGDILTYIGSFRMTNIVLTSLDFTTNSSNRDGFSFTAAFQRGEFVDAQYVESGETPLMSQQDAGKSEAAQTGAKPSQDGLQTTTAEAISSSAYADYVNTFNNKTTPSTGPSARSTPTYNGYS